jgi:hypothetical protein
MINGYTYYQKHTLSKGHFRWSCSRFECKAFARLNENEEIIQGNFDHPHPPAKYHKLANGKYVRI